MTRQAVRTINGTVLSTCSSFRYDPELVALKKKLDSSLGPPEIVTVCSPCYQDLARYTVHGIEIMMYVVSPNTVVRLRNIGTSQRRHVILLEFADGACGVIHSWEGHAYSVTTHSPRGQEVARLGIKESSAQMVEAVLDSFESGRPVVPYGEAVEVIKIIEAAVASRAAGGKTVELQS